MDSKQLQNKVQAFAQRLLDEAGGDPVRALGLLVLILDGSDLAPATHAQRLVVEIRKVLLPDQGLTSETTRPIQHLAGPLSWEGIQHCLRCARSLTKDCRDGGAALPPGYVYEIGSRIAIECDEDFDICL